MKIVHSIENIAEMLFENGVFPADMERKALIPMLSDKTHKQNYKIEYGKVLPVTCSNVSKIYNKTR